MKVVKVFVFHNSERFLICETSSTVKEHDKESIFKGMPEKQKRVAWQGCRGTEKLPANTRRRTDVYLILVHRLRRWPNIK